MGEAEGSLTALEELMADEEGHIDFLETQLDLVDKLGLQLYSQGHMGKPGKAED